MKGPVCLVEERSLVYKLIAFLYFSVLPAAILQKPGLLLLAGAPVVWFLYRQIQYHSLPNEHRRAFLHYRQKNWDKSIEALTDLLHRCPHYFPAYILLALVYTRAGRFEEALDIASRLGADWPDIAQDIQTDIWRFKRIDERRKGLGLAGKQTEPRPLEQQ
jgi:tetratricopeptide (TPR) repeat protein